MGSKLKIVKEFGELALPALRTASKSHASLEGRRRALKVLGKLEDFTPSGIRLRLLRAVEVIELIGDLEARNLLEVYSRGIAGVPLTEYAKASLVRKSIIWR